MGFKQIRAVWLRPDKGRFTLFFKRQRRCSDVGSNERRAVCIRRRGAGGGVLFARLRGEGGRSSDPNARMCRSDGYLPYGELTCSEFSYVEYCPEDASYTKCNNQKWCEDNGYRVLTEDCTVPEYADEQCPNGLELYKRCKADYEQACEEEDEGYVSECQEGGNLDKDALCS